MQIEEQYKSEEPLSFYQKRQLDFERECMLLNIDINSNAAQELRKSAKSTNINAATNAASTNYYDEVWVDLLLYCVDINSSFCECVFILIPNIYILKESLVNCYDSDLFFNLQGIMPTNIGSRRSSHAIKQLSITKDDSFEEEEESEAEEV